MDYVNEFWEKVKSENPDKYVVFSNPVFDGGGYCRR